MMTEIQDLQEEIRLLKEREASLQRQLMLERERRLHAEKIIENEKNACLELKTLLEQQDKKFRATIALPPSQFTNYFVRDSKSLPVCIFNIMHTYTYLCSIIKTQIHTKMYACICNDAQKVHTHTHMHICLCVCMLNLITISEFT